MNNYQAEQARMRDIIRQTASGVADALGDWKVNTGEQYGEYRGVYLDGPDGGRLVLSLDWKDSGRLEVSGIYPQHELHNVERFSIGVKRDRGPEVIAKEIRRRLLAGYFPELARVHADNVDRDACANSRRELAVRLAEASGCGSVSEDSNRSNRSRVHFYSTGGGWYGDADISYRADSVSMELRGLTAETAEAVLRLIAGRD